VIAVDTSALMAIILEEPDAAACSVALANATGLIISAGTLTEALIVAGSRDLLEQMDRIVTNSGFKVIPVGIDEARHAAAAHRIFGRGIHPAKLNFGDCFSYAVAKKFGCPLLFSGNDFGKTDIEPAIKR
jgi:ribonuclease VapC